MGLFKNCPFMEKRTFTQPGYIIKDILNAIAILVYLLLLEITSLLAQTEQLMAFTDIRWVCMFMSVS